MATLRIPALIALDDSAAPLRVEADKGLMGFIAYPPSGIRYFGCRARIVLFKDTGAVNRSIHFKTGLIGKDDTSEDAATTLDFLISHNASNELEIHAWNAGAPQGIKISSAGLVTINGTLAQPLPGMPTFLSGALTHDPAAIAAGATLNVTITVTGCTTTNVPTVIVTPSTDLNVLGINLVQPRVTANDTVTVGYYNFSGGSVNLASHTIRATVFQY